jgi:hypothetical protein
MLLMKTIVLLGIAAIGSSLLVASPSMAQPQLQFGIGQDGRPEFGVRDPEQERRERFRREREERRAYEAGRRDAERNDRRYGAYESRCRNITIQEEDRWGRTVERRIRRCD